MKKAHFPRPVASVVIALLGAYLPLSGGEILQELNGAQQARLLKGEQVVVSEEVDGKPWPRLSVYQIVDSTPEEVAAVFFDFDNNKSFVPNLLKSQVSKKISNTCHEVDYAVDIPIFPDEFYTARNTTLLVAPGRYRIDWTLVRAVQTKDSLGCLRIEPQDGGAIVCYRNLVTPGSAMAGLLRKAAIAQMKDAATAIANQAQKEKASNPTLLKKQVEALRVALQ